MRQDIQLSEDGGLLIRNGDFIINPSDQQHVKDIVIAHPGEFKESSMIGFAAMLQLKKNADEYSFKRDLKIQLDFDGYQNPDIDLTGGFEQMQITI